jgi:hypothetical protein
MNLREWFGGGEEPWRHLATRNPIEVVDEDTGEIVELTPGRDDAGDIEGLLIHFSYVDAGGAVTRRSLLCWQCWRDGNRLYVRGYCPLREALRTFRVDRMSDLSEVRGQRQIPVAEIESYFAAFADPTDRTKSGPDAGNWRLPATEDIEREALRRHIRHRARRDCIAGLRVLAYIALADNVRSEEERNVEISYIESRLAMCGYAYDSELTDTLVNVARALAVPPGSLTRALNEVASDSDYYMLVLSSAELLAHIDGTVGKLEAHALHRLKALGLKFQ